MSAGGDLGLEVVITAALAEDLAAGDITSRLLIPEGTRGAGDIVARSGCVVAGVLIARDVMLRLDPGAHFEGFAPDGTSVPPGTKLARVQGDLRALLAAERTALNLLQRASGIATATRRCVDLLAAAGAVSAATGRPVQVLDTRKTAPGLRALDRLAVRCGGGMNHRRSLGDMVLVKDNHVAAAGSVTQALALALAGAGHAVRVEIEVDSLAQLDLILAAPRLPDSVLLDNFTPDTVGEAVRRIAGRVFVEVSGGVTAATLAAYGTAGPDGISLGALTHSVVAADVAFDLAAAAP